VAIGQHDSNLKAVMDQNVELREQQEKKEEQWAVRKVQEMNGK
jgi:hypothetical protein